GVRQRRHALEHPDHVAGRRARVREDGHVGQLRCSKPAAAVVRERTRGLLDDGEREAVCDRVVCEQCVSVVGSGGRGESRGAGVGRGRGNRISDASVILDGGASRKERAEKSEPKRASREWRYRSRFPTAMTIVSELLEVTRSTLRALSPAC